MKKRILALVIMAAGLTSGCAEDAPKNESSGYVHTSDSYRNVYEDGMIYSAGQEPNKVLRYIDFSSLESSAFCAVPNCTHSSSASECLSRLVGDHPVLIDDSVYYFKVNGNHDDGEMIETPDGPEFVMETKLMKVSLDSSVTENVCEFTDALPRYWDNFIVIDNMLYFAAYDPDPVFDGMGGASWGSSGGYDFLCSIDLDTGEYTNYGSICYVEDEFPSASNSSGARLVGYYEGKLWLSYSFLEEDPIFDTETGQYTYMPEFTVYNFEFDPETKQYTRSDFPAPTKIEDGYYIYRETDEGAPPFMAMKDGKTYDTHLNDAYSVVNGKCCKRGFEEPASWVNIGEDTVHKIGGEYEGYYITAYHDGKYILINDKYDAVKLTEEELLSASEIKED